MSPDPEAAWAFYAALFGWERHNAIDAVPSVLDALREGLPRDTRFLMPEILQPQREIRLSLKLVF